MFQKSLLIAWSLVACIQSRAAESPPAATHSGNPLFPGWYADPEAIIIGNEYWIYHRRPLTETHGNHRVTCIDRMEFDAAGLIKPIKLTHQGVPSRTLDKSTDEEATRANR